MPLNPSRGRAPWTALPCGSRISGFGMTLTTTRATGCSPVDGWNDRATLSTLRSGRCDAASAGTSTGRDHEARGVVPDAVHLPRGLGGGARGRLAAALLPGRGQGGGGAERASSRRELPA